MGFEESSSFGSSRPCRLAHYVSLRCPELKCDHTRGRHPSVELRCLTDAFERQCSVRTRLGIQAEYSLVQKHFAVQKLRKDSYPLRQPTCGRIQELFRHMQTVDGFHAKGKGQKEQESSCI